jgi:hypothetical protein
MDTLTDQSSTHFILTQRMRTMDPAIANMATCLSSINSKIDQMQTQLDDHSATHAPTLAFLRAEVE